MTSGADDVRGSDPQASSAGFPTVSVVIPTRDRPELLTRAVGAVLGQRYEGEVECIVVFDRSDPVRPEVDVGSGRELRCIANTRTPGLAGARNSGAMGARGELLAFCDDDDEWLPEKLSRQVARLAREHDAVAVASGILVRANGRDISRVPDRSSITFRDLLRSRWMEINPCNILVRRTDFLGRIGMVDENVPGGHNEDYEWLLRATRHGPIAVVRAPLVRIHWHESSFFAQRWRNLIAGHRYLLDRYPEFATDRRGLARLYGQLAFYHAAAGDRREGMSWAMKTLRANVFERRAYLAVAVALRLVSASRLLALANRFGRGI